MIRSNTFLAKVDDSFISKVVSGSAYLGEYSSPHSKHNLSTKKLAEKMEENRKMKFLMLAALPENKFKKMVERRPYIPPQPLQQVASFRQSNDEAQ